MDTSILEDLGLTGAEIRVFLTSLELGSSSAGPIVEKSGLQNAVVHRALHSLIEKGLVTYILEGKKRIYQAVERAIANGTVDAGGTADNVYNAMVDAGEIDPEVNVIFHTSDPIPGSPIAVRGDLSEELKQRIQQALIEMDEQTIHAVGGWGSIERYEKAEDSDYDIIRETAEVMDLDLTKQ